MKSILLALPLVITSTALAVTPQVGDVTDQRTTGQFFADLNVELKLLGDDVSDIKAVRVLVDKAVDDTGKDLINAEKVEKDFQEIGQYSRTLKLVLKNPARKAATFSFSGSLSSINPSKDPGSKLVFEKVLSKSGAELKNPAFSAAKISFSVMTKADVEKAEANKKKTEDAAKAQGPQDGMAQLFQNAFMGGMTLGENDLQYKISDPEKKIVSFRLLKPGGEEVNRSSYMTSGEVRTYSYTESIPADATLEVIVATDKSLETVPFNFSGVFLP
jgi:hypothetical protein